MKGWSRTAGTLVLALAAAAGARAASPVLRVASVQTVVGEDLAANLARVLKGIEDGAAAGARLVVLPETVLSGFSRSAVEGLDWDRLDAAMASVAEAARAHGVYVIYGTATRSPFPRPYNSALVVGPDGQEVFRYHKSFPEGWFEPGNKLALFEIDGVPCTLIVCHDNRFPELVRVPVLAGARVCFYISYEINGRAGADRKREGYRAQSIARAAENGIWWVQANGVGPMGADTLSLGNSVVVAPSGEVVAAAPQLEEAVITADVVPNAAGRGNALEGLDGKVLGDWWKEALLRLEAQRSEGEGQR